MSRRSAFAASLASTVSLAVVACGATGCTRSNEGVDAATADASVVTAPARIASCDRITSMSVCSEYSGSFLAHNEAIHSAGCAKLGGSFSAGECPNTSVLGACTLSTGELRKFYGTGGAAWTAATAEKECAGAYRGKWKAQ